MVKIIGFLRFVTMEFGAIIVFWVGLYSFGLKPAIAATIAFILLDALYRIWRKLAVTRLYVMVSCMTLVFGAIDLYAATPFMLKY
ncbi:MAG: hypothetical protein KGJ29_15145, partial [Hyphomicrobiales bacterium]|nr:hypothetical protein [Hyphomicrobiales bacterium]